jgi:purine nucleoside phosphorylase
VGIICGSGLSEFGGLNETTEYKILHSSHQSLLHLDQMLRTFLLVWCIYVNMCAGGIGDLLEERVSFSYEDIPHFPLSKVPGHRGELSLGYLERVPTVCFQGRSHYYEGYPMSKVNTTFVH